MAFYALRKKSAHLAQAEVLNLVTMAMGPVAMVVAIAPLKQAGCAQRRDRPSLQFAVMEIFLAMRFATMAIRKMGIIVRQIVPR